MEVNVTVKTLSTTHASSLTISILTNIIIAKMTLKRDKMNSLKILLVLSLFYVSAQGASSQNDDANIKVLKQSIEIPLIADIDHSGLAKNENEALNPSHVVIFSDSKINTLLLQENPLVGIDLPFKFLSFRADDDNTYLIATEADYLKKRHNLKNDAAIDLYDKKLESYLSNPLLSPKKHIDIENMPAEYGLIRFESDFNFMETRKRLKKIVLGDNDDTIWFGEIDYTHEAKQHGVTLPNILLVLFGAPAPGAKAMRSYPRLGLDAFCQKILLVENNGKTYIYMNDIVDFARLHYGSSKFAHWFINYRIKQAMKDVAYK